MVSSYLKKSDLWSKQDTLESWREVPSPLASDWPGLLQIGWPLVSGQHAWCSSSSGWALLRRMAEAVSDAFFHLLRAGGNYAKQVPGLDIVISYIENSYQNDPFRVLLEAIVTGWMLWYLLKPRPKDIKDELTPGVNRPAITNL